MNGTAARIGTTSATPKSGSSQSTETASGESLVTPVRSNRRNQAGPAAASILGKSQKRPSIDVTVRHSNAGPEGFVGTRETSSPTVNGYLDSAGLAPPTVSSTPRVNVNANANSQSPVGLRDGLMDDDISTAVCCGCGRRPRQRDRKYRRRKGPAQWLTQRRRNRHASMASSKEGSIASGSIRTNDFHDTNQSQVGSFGWPANDTDADSLYFFDAEQEALADDEYPIVILTERPPAKPYVTFEEPATMLSPDDSMRSVYEAAAERSSDIHSVDGRPSAAVVSEDEGDDLDDDAASHGHSVRLSSIVRRPTLEHQQSLQHPRVVVPIKGFPGSLSVHELSLCQRFIREIRQRPPAVAEQVYNMRDIEDEPYAVCRWLRATKFDVDAILQRLEDNKEAWNEAKSNNFYPDPNKALGAPYSVFLSQYPFLSIGQAKNGCPVNYFQCGKIRPEGILCLTTKKHMEDYFWYQFVHRFKGALRRAQEADPNFVRVEGINILDLSHLSTSALTSDTMDVIKIAGKISDFFPETLHCMLILNAPSFFAMSWSVIRKFVDPRTAARIQVFSSAKKGMARVRELIDDTEIPADYGGSGPSIEQVLLQEAKNSSLSSVSDLKRQEYELLHIKKKGGKAHHVFPLADGESMEVRVYTRSVSSARVTAKWCSLSDKSDSKLLRQVLSRGKLGTDPDSAGNASLGSNGSLDPMVLPSEKLVVKDVTGPGTVAVEAVDQDDVNHSKWHGHSRGYFLVVANVWQSGV